MEESVQKPEGYSNYCIFEENSSFLEVLRVNSADALIQILKKHTSIKSININQCNLNEHEWNRVIDNLPANLEKLYIEFCATQEHYISFAMGKKLAMLPIKHFQLNVSMLNTYCYSNEKKKKDAI